MDNNNENKEDSVGLDRVNEYDQAQSMYDFFSCFFDKYINHGHDHLYDNYMRLLYLTVLLSKDRFPNVHRDGDIWYSAYVGPGAKDGWKTITFLTRNDHLKSQAGFVASFNDASVNLTADEWAWELLAEWKNNSQMPGV